MPTYIIHHEGAYNMFSTISDNPVFEKAMSLNDFKREYQNAYGAGAMLGLAERLERAHQNGISERKERNYTPSLENTVFMMLHNNTPEEFKRFRNPAAADSCDGHDYEGFMKLFIEKYLTIEKRGEL